MTRLSLSGTVALTLVVAVWLLRSGSSSDRENIEQLVDETDLVLHVRLAREAMTSADHAHDFETLDRSGRRLHGLKASRGSNDSFESAVVGLDDVVEILARAMLRVGRHFSFSLQPGDGFGIGSELVCLDRGRWPVAHGRQRFSEETIGRTRVPSVRQHEVDHCRVSERRAAARLEQ
jgi:hypothetical protein